MTPAQIIALRAACFNDPTAAAFFVSPGNSPGLLTYLNSTHSTWVSWKSAVTIRETGQVFDGTEWAGMTTANHTRLQTVAQYLMAYSPSIAGIRAMFNDIWSGAGGVTTRANLLALWKRSVTVCERFLSTGTGSDASPGTLTFEGSISQTDATLLIYKSDGTLWTAGG